MFFNPSKIYILHFILYISARERAACRGAFSALPFFEIRLLFALRYAILKMAHNFTFFSNHGIRNRHFVSLISHALEIVCQRSEILMQGVSSVEGTLFYFRRVLPCKKFGRKHHEKTVDHAALPGDDFGLHGHPRRL